MAKRNTYMTAAKATGAAFVFALAAAVLEKTPQINDFAQDALKNALCKRFDRFCDGEAESPDTSIRSRSAQKTDNSSPALL